MRDSLWVKRNQVKIQESPEDRIYKEPSCRFHLPSGPALCPFSRLFLLHIEQEFLLFACNNGHSFIFLALHSCVRFFSWELGSSTALPVSLYRDCHSRATVSIDLNILQGRFLLSISHPCTPTSASPLVTLKDTVSNCGCVPHYYWGEPKEKGKDKDLKRTGAVWCVCVCVLFNIKTISRKIISTLIISTLII